MQDFFFYCNGDQEQITYQILKMILTFKTQSQLCGDSQLIEANELLLILR